MQAENSSKRIVLVDDDETNMFICRKLLNIFDPKIEVIEFLDPTLALDYFSEQLKSKICLLLLDLNMPKINGWQFLDSVKKGNFDSDVVILSSSIDPNDIQKAKKEGKVKDYWTKPLTLEMLSQYFAK